MRPRQFRDKVDRLEFEFRADLMRALRAASEDAGSWFFRSEEHNQIRELSGSTDALTNELLERANEIIALRAKLNEWPEKSLAARFVIYCERFNDVKDQHQPGVRKHANALIQEIEAMSFG